MRKKKENGENHGRTRLIKILGWPSGPPPARYRKGESVYCFGTGYAESCDVRDAGRRGSEGGGVERGTWEWKDSVRTSVTSCDSGLGQTDWLVGNHFHCAEGLGLELHGRLLEARAGRWRRPRTLVL